jgi:hypothetical protein
MPVVDAGMVTRKTSNAFRVDLDTAFQANKERLEFPRLYYPATDMSKVPNWRCYELLQECTSTGMRRFPYNVIFVTKILPLRDQTYQQGNVQATGLAVPFRIEEHAGEF